MVIQNTMKKYISVLTVISALAVVFLHANGCFWHFSYEKYWFSANIIECLFYFAVPVFYMITGVTLLDYSERYNTKTYIKKRFFKTFLPFIIWSIIGIFYTKSIGGFHWRDVNFSWFVDVFMNTKLVHIYWFFIPLFSLYMFIPFIAKIPKIQRKNIFLYAILSMFILNVLLPLVFTICGFSYNNSIKFFI